MTFGYNEVSGVCEFPSTEHAYQCTKLWFHGQANVYPKLVNKSAREAMTVGSKTRVNEEWRRVRTEVMRRILEAKCVQHERVRSYLDQTGSSRLIEDTPHPFWGRGRDGFGENMLGRMWMEVRQCMRASRPLKELGMQGGKEGVLRDNGPSTDRLRPRGGEVSVESVKPPEVGAVLVLSDSMLTDRGDVNVEALLEASCGRKVVVMATRGASLGRAQAVGVRNVWNIESELYKRRIDKGSVAQCVLVIGTNDLSNGFDANYGSESIAGRIGSGLLDVGEAISEICVNCSQFGWISIMPRRDRNGMMRECMEVARSNVNAVVSGLLSDRGWEVRGVENVFSGNVQTLLFVDGLHPSTEGKLALVQALEAMMK